MRRTVKVLVVGALLLALTAGVALAALREGNDNPNDLVGTTGSNEVQGQDFLFGFGADDDLRGKTGPDYAWGGSGPDTVIGGNGDDVLDGGNGEDTITTNKGFDVVYAGDGTKDIIDCNHESGYFVATWDPGIDTDIDEDNKDMCPGTFDPSAGQSASVTAAGASEEGSPAEGALEKQ
jgi:Ca2+-binding RTX toxin-like protein